MNLSERVLYEVRGIPVLQNKVYQDREDALNCPTGDLTLVQSEKTGLVYNATFEADLVVYDQGYNNEQANSPAFQCHLEEVADIITKYMGSSRLIEIGCGKGHFLEMLRGIGVDIKGYDSSYEGNDPDIQCRHFDPSMRSEAEGVILRHVLEHVQNPWSFLDDIRIANGRHGLVYVEVPCLDWILKRKAWFDVFYEHVNYFRVSDFENMFGKVVAKGKIFGGQYLYVVAELESLRDPVAQLVEKVDFPADFLGSLSPEKKPDVKGEKVAIWGGSSKGVIYSLMKSRKGHPIDMVVDINPDKQGCYLPVTGVRVISPDECKRCLPSGSTVFVMNSNYMEEIKHMTSGKYIYVSIEQ